MHPSKPLMESRLSSGNETRDLTVINEFSDFSLKKCKRTPLQALLQCPDSCTFPFETQFDMLENHFTEFLTKKQWLVWWAPSESSVGLRFQSDS